MKDNPRMKVNPNDSIDDRELASVLMEKELKKNKTEREREWSEWESKSIHFLYEGIVFIARSMCISF